MATATSTTSTTPRKTKSKSGSAASTGAFSVSGPDIDRAGYESGDAALSAAVTFAVRHPREVREATYYVRDEDGKVFGRTERTRNGEVFTIRGNGPTPTPTAKREERNFIMAKDKQPGPKEQQQREQREQRATEGVKLTPKKKKTAEEPKSTEPQEHAGVDVIGFEFDSDKGRMKVVGHSTTAGYVDVESLDGKIKTQRKTDQVVTAMTGQATEEKLTEQVEQVVEELAEEVEQAEQAVKKTTAKKKAVVKEAPEVEDVTGKEQEPKVSKTALALEGAVKVLRDHKGPMTSQEMFQAILATPGYSDVNTGTVIVMLSKELRQPNPRVKRIGKGTYEAA